MKLVEYKEKNGHCNCPTKNGSLGRWILNQRTSFISKKLKADRYEKLVEIGFVFEGFAIDEKWNSRFVELVEYKEKNGHCNCPIKKNGSFGNWVSLQRTLFRSKKLKEDRYEKLVGIGFVFEDDRSSFTSKKLKVDRYEKLVEIGFVYEGFAIDEKWNSRFVELVEYKENKEKNGHCNCPIKKNGSYGNWVSLQRTLFRSKKLKEDRYEKLVGIGFVFEDDRSQKWLDDMYQKLLEHKETKGHCFDVPSILPLGRWLREQRWRCRNGKLREDRAEKLLSIGFDLKKGGVFGVRDASSGQRPRKKRKAENLDNDLTTMIHDERAEGIDDINANDDVNDNDNGNGHAEVVEEHIVAATELVVEGIKEGHSSEEVAPPLKKNNEVHKYGPAVSV
eukprot:scaffold6574_cov261-Chaetoceros_neogracile.AAC.25